MPAFWTDLYRDHFQMHFGKPFDVQVYHGPDDTALKLATHDWAMPGFRVIASLGIADLLAREGEEAVGEVILYCDVPDKETHRLFVNALFFVIQNRIPLTSRFSIGFANLERTFSQRHGKSALYFTRAFSPDGEFDRVGDLARVYQAFFITPKEDEFLDAHGPLEFETRFWETLGEDYRRDEPMRPPVDLKEMPAYTERVNALWANAAKLFSVHRKGFVV